MHIAFVVAALVVPTQDPGASLASRVEVVRTEYGVPHILAQDLEAMGYALAWVQSEDYGDQIALGMVRQRGTWARYVGHDSIDGDFAAREAHAIAVASFHRLDEATRLVYRGFAAGVNRYVQTHPDEFPAWLEPDFTGVDALAADVQTWSRGEATQFARREARRLGIDTASRSDRPTPLPFRAPTSSPDAFDPDVDGSNAWAFDGSRTTSGHAILLRNPHLAWTAGYYEAHVRVPGVLDFYGDFRIGGAFGIIGGFNARLGWATTNNSPRYSQVYALRRHPRAPDHAMLDGAPVPLERRLLSVDYLAEDGSVGIETEETLWTPYGPVVLETDSLLYILKDPRHGEFRRGEQFLRMMRTTSLDEWLDVMRMRAHSSSNLTYADADGNIVLYYNARIPSLPHAVTDDTAAVATSEADLWSELVPWERLPLYVNPPGGYVQQANDTPDFINLNVHLDRDTVAPNLPEPRLRLRSQLSLDLVHNDRVLSLEDMIELKHSPRMLAAERMLDDLLAALDATEPHPDLVAARAVLGRWDRTAGAQSRGGVLFERWIERYGEVTDTLFYRQDWDVERPVTTPYGIGSPGQAVAALRMVVEEMRAEGTALDVRWGDVHRVVLGDVDEPVSGCDGGLGCFRTLSFEELDDGRLAANRGDGWVLAVEFGDRPRGYSVLAYGQSRREDSPHHADQAAMFAHGRMKPIAWTDAEIEAAAIRRYRPGAGLAAAGSR